MVERPKPNSTGTEKASIAQGSLVGCASYLSSTRAWATVTAAQPCKIASFGNQELEAVQVGSSTSMDLCVVCYKMKRGDCGSTAMAIPDLCSISSVTALQLGGARACSAVRTTAGSQFVLVSTSSMLCRGYGQMRSSSCCWQLRGPCAPSYEGSSPWASTACG